jgi:hypothetical protein
MKCISLKMVSFHFTHQCTHGCYAKTGDWARFKSYNQNTMNRDIRFLIHCHCVGNPVAIFNPVIGGAPKKDSH